MLPVVSAATALGLAGTLLFTAMAAAAYLSFLLYLDWNIFTLDWPEVGVLIQRVLALFLVGNLANVLAEALREQSEKHRRAAEQLAEANQQVLEAEEAVRRSDRLAALGQLTAGLAHELRNPLGTIKASAEMLGNMLSTENEVAREVAGYISSEVDRTNSLVTRFLQFARPLQAAAGDGGPVTGAGSRHRGGGARDRGHRDLQDLRARRSRPSRSTPN